MTGSKNQIERLFTIDQKLRNNEYPNKKRMAQFFLVSEKTIERDITFMKEHLKAPVLYSRERKGYYYKKDGYFLPSLFMSEGEVFTFAIAKEVLQQYRSTPLFPILDKAFQKLEHLLPDRTSIHSEWLSNRFTMFHEPLAIIDPKIWKTVLKAVKISRYMTFEYRSPGSKQTQFRRMAPYHAFCHKANWYVIGEDTKRNAIRTFALSRMQTVVIGKEQFSIPEDFTLHDYVDPNMGILSSGKLRKYVIQFSPQVADYARERIWHPTQKLETLDDGSVRLSFESSQFHAVKNWLLSWGEFVQVLEPEELVTGIIKTAREILKHYKAL